MSALVKLAAASAAVATIADHAEHGEPTALHGLQRAGRLCADAAMELATSHGMSMLAAYADRLQAIENDSPLGPPGNAPAAVRVATTWRQLQIAQIDHDRRFHPDVFGLSKLEQIRHYAFHLAKFPDAVLASDDMQLRSRRIPDMLLFAIKLWTISGSRLPDVPISTPIDFAN